MEIFPRSTSRLAVVTIFFILPTNCAHSETDITTVFGTVFGGSSPSGRTKMGGFNCPFPYPTSPD